MRIQINSSEGVSVDQDENASTTSVESESSESAQSMDVPNTPNLSYLTHHFAQALESFYTSIDKIKQDNDLDVNAFLALANKLKSAELTSAELRQFEELKLAAQRQGRAIGAVIGFFLKFKPYPMLAEVRKKGGLYQPMFGPVLIARAEDVRDVLVRHGEFTVDPYGTHMCKSMSPEYNGGYDTFILSTDNDERYIQDKHLLTSVVSAGDVPTVTDLIHQETQKRIKQAVTDAKHTGSNSIDVVPTVARFVPVFLVHHYLGVPAAEKPCRFELDDNMLKYYGNKVTGPDGIEPLPISYTEPDGSVTELPDSALKREDGIIPDEQQVYDWIVACFKHFFNNLQNDVKVQAYGVRAYRQLLVYILHEIDIQRKALTTDPDSVADNMLTRLLRIQMGLPQVIEDKQIAIEADRVSDLRIAENVMGTIVGAVAGQEEATCRVIDSMIRLQEGEFEPTQNASPPEGLKYGDFEHACELARNIVNGIEVAQSRTELLGYVFEALRLQPQGEILLRQCVKDGAVIANSNPIRKGTLVFAAHGSAMQDTEQPETFVLGRPKDNYLHYGYGRHQCLGQYVSPILMSEALVAILNLQNVRRPEPNTGELAFPLERRFGRFQLDDDNLYAKTFSLQFDH